MRFIINAHFGKILSDPQAKILKEFNTVNADQALTTGNFDLLPAGS
jgi:hypothetical protein